LVFTFCFLSDMPPKNAFAVLMAAARKSPPRESSPKKNRKLEPREPLTDQQKETLKTNLTVPHYQFTTRKEFEHFYQQTIAPFILNQVEIVAGGERLTIKEIEFYFTNPTHPDPFTHCQPLQEQSFIWYFHRTGKTYKSGTYKGLDIAIGRGSTAPGGILIRTVEQLSNGKIICGPCNTVDHLLKLCGAATINDLVESQMKDDISIFGGQCNQLYLYPLDEPRDDKILHTGRVGLYMTKRNVKLEVQEEYVMRNYRSIVEPRKVWKGKHLMVCSLLNDGKSVHEIVQVTGMKEATVGRFKESFKNGLKNDKDISYFAGKRISDELACECFGLIIARYNASKKEKQVEKEEASEESDDDFHPSELAEDDASSTPEKETGDLMSWVLWKIQSAMKDNGNEKIIELKPFPSSSVKELFGKVLEEATNISEHPEEESIYKLSKEVLQSIFGEQWWILNDTDENSTSKITSDIELVFTLSEDDALVLRFSTEDSNL